MPAKKTTTAALTTGNAATTPAKKTAVVKKAAVKKTAAAKPVAAKPAAAVAPKKSSASPTREQVAQAAYLKYCERKELGLEGDSHTD